MNEKRLEKDANKMIDKLIWGAPRGSELSATVGFSELINRRSNRQTVVTILAEEIRTAGTRENQSSRCQYRSRFVDMNGQCLRYNTNQPEPPRKRTRKGGRPKALENVVENGFSPPVLSEPRALDTDFNMDQGDGMVCDEVVWYLACTESS
jgi:hypothetical protein